MTKKDYQTIGNAIISASTDLTREQINTLVIEFCYYLGRENKDFDTQKFTLYVDNGIDRLEL